ncbi:MAG: peptide ABC transporter permease [Betaproteobacteria bacterium HGW-Betaproteobacteria-11]|nr:MAG: peptide ABC transporter permease [Betaproteobacteria bacterium HGW-Betaproteobacteria-11]
MTPDFQPVLLWSDALLFALLAAGAGFAWWSRRQVQLAVAWARVGRNPLAMAAATLLAFFVLVGTLDSLHYRPRLPPVPGQAAAGTQYAVEVLSALDALLAPLRENSEKTYSAPLATHLFAKETLPGSTLRDFPRLHWGGQHLGERLAAYDGDIARRALLGLTGGLLAWALALLPWRKKLGAGNAAKKAVALTLLTVFLLAGVAFALGQGYHVLGTDKVGQDVLYLSLKSIRTGLLIGTLTTLVTLPLAVLFGILAGYLGGWVDDVIQYLYTTLNSIPGVLLIAAAVLMMQVVIDAHPGWFATTAERADARLLALCLILGMTSWTGLARLLRGETLKLRELEFVQAARAFGAGHGTIMRRHILPNLLHLVVIALVMDFSGLVLAEAVLSYVGVGVDPTTISFGTMINAARMELAREPMVWWSLVAAFGFMFVLVLAANLFADAVREAFDPRTSS